VVTSPASAAANSYGIFSQSVWADGYVFRRIRLRMAVRADDGGGQARLWLQINRRNNGGASFNQTSSAITSSTWTYYQMDADVPFDSQIVNFGVLVYSGTVWVDDASFTLTGSGPSEPPRPLSDNGLANLSAFAKVFGYVRHFHPSDQSYLIDWEGFAVQGVRAVEDAATPQDLATRLQALFQPIAPTVRVFVQGNRPTLPAELQPASTAGLQVTRWDHFGVQMSGTFYIDQRLKSPVQGSQLPAGFVDPAQPYEAPIGQGLSLLVPLSLYVDSKGTMPAQAAATIAPNYSGVDDRATRLAGIIVAWNAVQHFYPYFDVVQADWPAALADGLRSAATNSGLTDFQATAGRFAAAYHDGHARVIGPNPATVPLVWDWVENQLVITYVVDDQGKGLLPGDRVVKIDGVAADSAIAQAGQRISGATPQWILWRSLLTVTICNGSAMQLEVEPYASPGSTRAVQIACGQYLDFLDPHSFTEPRGSVVQTLEPGIQYVDLNRLTTADWNAALPSLASAKGIVFDMRGYPLTTVWLQNLWQSHLNSAQWHIPKPAKPDRTDFPFQQDPSWDLVPLIPYLTANRVFLTSGRSISFAESVMGIVEYYKLGEIVGGPTAGTNGNVNEFLIPGGLTMRFTGMKVLKQDGTQHHGVGIRTTIPATRTRQGIVAGRDEVLARGVEVVKGPQAGATPQISAAGIVNGANFSSGSVTPGEIVTIFGTSLGPAELAAGSFDGSGFLSNYAAGTRVFFDGIQAPLIYASGTQVSAIVPYKAASNTRVRVEYQLRNSNEVLLPVAAAAPGIFAYGGQSQAVVVNQDRSFNSSTKLATRGEVVTLFATGEGPVSPAPIDGKLPIAGSWPAPVGNVTVTFGGVPGDILFKGTISPGVMQLNVRVPLAAPAGAAVPLALSVSGIADPRSVTIALQ
jgi:uncharacterized protein (TIGR03437 family)